LPKAAVPGRRGSRDRAEAAGAGLHAGIAEGLHAIRERRRIVKRTAALAVLLFVAIQRTVPAGAPGAIEWDHFVGAAAYQVTASRSVCCRIS
jgi:hypothetical protein